MSLHLVIIFSLLIGAIEWYLALRRTLACMRGEIAILVVIVSIENLLGFGVNYLFNKVDAWPVALPYTLGAGISTYVTMKYEMKNKIKNVENNDNKYIDKNILMF